MRVTAPVTDYIRASVMSVRGDLAVRGALVPERLPAGAYGSYFQGKGAGILPAYDKQMPPLSVYGDLIMQGAVVPQSRPSVATGKVLTSHGIAANVYYEDLFNLLTTRGDIWVRGASWAQKLAAGALDTYLKAKGAGNLPIYEKLALRDTGFKIDRLVRSTGGVQVITGVGFKPSLIIILAVDGTPVNRNFSIGIVSETEGNYNIYFSDSGTEISDGGFAVNIFRTVANILSGMITAFSADGFTMTWSLTGTVDLFWIYVCIP